MFISPNPPHSQFMKFKQIRNFSCPKNSANLRVRSQRDALVLTHPCSLRKFLYFGPQSLGNRYYVFKHLLSLSVCFQKALYFKMKQNNKNKSQNYYRVIIYQHSEYKLQNLLFSRVNINTISIIKFKSRFENKLSNKLK